jgi:hypothetical protein
VSTCSTTRIRKAFVSNYSQQPKSDTNLSESVNPVRYKFIRQGISITGAGTTTFYEAVKAAQDIYTHFHRQFPDGKLESWSAATYAGHQALDITNRYFTPKRDAPEMEHIPFSEAVDPHGILADMTKSGYIHGEENNVLYYACHINEEGIKR